MKNLLIYISPNKSFDNPRHDLINDAGVSAQVQIENSLELGWAKEDIILVTNFEYEYLGVSAIVLRDVDFFDRKPQASKINAIIKLFENGTIKSDETYWFHDLDAFQVCPTPELEIVVSDSEIALSDYGVHPRWSTGVIYFKDRSKDLFLKIKETTYRKNVDEERALEFLTKTNEGIAKRVKRIDKSYNFVPRSLEKMYAASEKNIRVIHFHPLGEVSPRERVSSFRVFNGDNPLGLRFIPDRLLKIFKKHGIQ